jgi:hypothetical protein
MKFHNEDGRVFEDAAGEWSPGAETQAGDFAWFEEDVLLVTRVEGDRATTIAHPAAQTMMNAVLNDEQGVKVGMIKAIRAHYLALGAMLLGAGGVHKEILERFKRERKWVRAAEEMAPREAAELVDSLRGVLAVAFEHTEAGRFDDAIASLRDDMNDDDKDG